MSTATAVPECRFLDGDSPTQLLRRQHAGALVKDTVIRFRRADGFSHARASAFQLTLVLLPASIVVVALAVTLQWGTLTDAVVHAVDTVAPGVVSRLFKDAIRHGAHTGEHNHWAAVAVGGVATLISGATGFGQVERGLNRLYGVELDRPSLRKYGFALVLTVTAGALGAAYLAITGLGTGRSHSTLHRLWVVVQWPLGIACLFAAALVALRWSPHRRQPTVPWLCLGAVVSALGMLIVSILLRIYLSTSSSFGDAYGPFAGLIGVLLWSYLTSIAFHLGAALAAQMEAARAGRPAPAIPADNVAPERPPSDQYDRPAWPRR